MHKQLNVLIQSYTTNHTNQSQGSHDACILYNNSLSSSSQYTHKVTGTFVPTYFRSQERKYHRWNFRSLVLSLPGTFAPGYFRSLEHSLPNAISKTRSFRSPCFKCVFLSKVTRTASSMLNRVCRPTRLMPSHQSQAGKQESKPS